MISTIRHSLKHLRLWLLAAAAMLLLVSIIEAGHVHGVFTETDDHCALCQHSVALDKMLLSVKAVFIPLLFVVFASTLPACFTSTLAHHFALIRAPPTQLHTR